MTFIRDLTIFAGVYLTFVVIALVWWVYIQMTITSQKENKNEKPNRLLGSDRIIESKTEPLP